MSKKIRKIVLLAMISVLSAAVLAGCKLGPTFDGVIKDNDLVACVTYHANGGFFGGNLTEKQLWYPVNSRPVDIGGAGIIVESNPITVTRSKHELGGWYYAQLDGSGNPVRDEDGDVVLDLTKPLDTTYLLQDGDRIEVYAMWLTEIKMELRAVTSDGGKITLVEKGADGNDVVKEYENGEAVSEYSFGDKNAVAKPASLSFNVKDKAYTWSQQYFYDEACTQPVSWPITPAEGSNENVPVYTKFIAGDWFIVSDADSFEDFVDKSAVDGNVKGYMVSDVDFGGDRLAINYFNGVLNGNGHAIKNFTVQMSSRNDSLRVNNTLYFIKSVGANASFNNVTFSSFTVKATVAPGVEMASATVYALIGAVEEGATFNGLTFSSFTVKITYDPDKCFIFNMQKTGEAYDLTHYLFESEESDAAFLAKYTGVTVSHTADDVIITEK